MRVENKTKVKEEDVKREILTGKKDGTEHREGEEEEENEIERKRAR